MPQKIKFARAVGEDSSDDKYINKRIKNLDNFFLIWLNNTHSKLKKLYTKNSRTTKFKKYGLSRTFTKAAKLSQPITNFFHKRQIEKVDDDKVDIDEIREDDNNELEDKDNGKELENNDYIELENKDEKEELRDNNEEDLENKDEELRDYDNDELEDKDDDEGLEENDNNTRDKNKCKIDNFNTKLVKLEEILFGNLKKMIVYDCLYYKAVHKFFKKWKYDNLSKKQASLHFAKVVYNKGSYKAKQIRIWAKYWIEYRTLPKSLQGCHQKIKSIIDDEDVIEQSLLFIHEKEGKTTPKEYQIFVEEVLFP
ncbi:hypothetical protein RclHR1_34470001 [Rhizophagus clarus]|uniref:Uncharacterized protein n=1 Tax=Rhizophagus clarus TaxID=94130 RepID=A0A2Z6RAQ8_9GLOM|nr:hypothetical protein RclHR1_34470001 [Rhizophagus clarus]